MHVSEIKSKNDNKRFFEIEIYSDSRAKKIDVKLDIIIKKIQTKFTLGDYIFLPTESSGNLSKSKRKGVYVFEKKQIDISNNYVKIDKTATVTETPVKKQAKAELKESLPYGLKKNPVKKATPRANTTRRKRAQRKTTEE